ncbi:MAG: hypothetical protein L7U70_04685 [Flavobacteriales bacterium]|nr:hypothetical protein [Flavobacteriales bacterium]
MKAHKSEMIAAWARDHGISGFEQYDPKVQEKNRMRAMKKRNERKEVNNSVTQR